MLEVYQVDAMGLNSYSRYHGSIAWRDSNYEQWAKNYWRVNVDSLTLVHMQHLSFTAHTALTHQIHLHTPHF